jgi:hypothetical protein
VKSTSASCVRRSCARRWWAWPSCLSPRRRRTRDGVAFITLADGQSPPIEPTAAWHAEIFTGRSFGKASPGAASDLGCSRLGSLAGTAAPGRVVACVGRDVYSGEHRDRLTVNLLYAGVLTAQVAARLPLAEAREAMTLAESHTVTGKVVIIP